MCYQLAACSLRDCLLKSIYFQIMRLKTIHLANASGFVSQAYNDYFMTVGISVEHPVAHVCTQNGLVESFINWTPPAND